MIGSKIAHEGSKVTKGDREKEYLKILAKVVMTPVLNAIFIK